MLTHVEVAIHLSHVEKSAGVVGVKSERLIKGIAVLKGFSGVFGWLHSIWWNRIQVSKTRKKLTAQPHILKLLLRHLD